MIGNVISHYSILEKLGEGGRGVVYKAHDAKLDRDVALKFLPSHLDATADDIARFEQEAKAISSLSHPSIATIFDIDEVEGHRFLVLEYIAGGTLKARIRRLHSEGNELSIAEVIDYGIQIADGLAHAHRHQIIHRDIKSDNIMLTEDGKIKITDFGLAKLCGHTRLTRTGSTLGTLAYMAPEQFRGEEIDQRADLFSLGVVLYEMATGWLPFRGEHEAALTYSIANEDPLPAKTVRENIPSELDQIITKALQKDRALRFQSADEVVADLQKLKQGITGTVKTVAVEKRSKILWIGAATIVVLGAIGMLFFMQSSQRTDTNSKTIAVLPFANLTEDKQEEYFSDGITEDILTQLAQIADINVISRTSIMQYKGTKKSIREIGRELNAGVILEGSVRRAGDKVRIGAQLIDAKSDRHVWAETYDREFRDILTIQSEIARNISTALHARISQKEREKLTTSTRENPELYRLLLQGKYYATRRDSANTMRGLETLQRALTIDSTDARVWVALSMALTNRAALGPSNVQDVVRRARAAAQRAVALDDNLADGHAALAFILTTFDWDWQTADEEYKKALALEPGNAATLRRKGVLAMCLGRLDESIKLTQRAIELDPVNDGNYLNLGICYYYSGRRGESTIALRKALDLNPLCPAAYQLWGANYIELGKIDSAIIITQKEADQVWRAFGLAIAYYAAGRGKESDQMLDVLVRNYKEGASYQIAAIYSYRNETDLAFEWLEKAYELRDGGLSQMMGDPLLSNIQKDARYSVFLKKMRLIE